jgi:hypothetical protein
MANFEFTWLPLGGSPCSRANNMAQLDIKAASVLLPLEYNMVLSLFGLETLVKP